MLFGQALGAIYLMLAIAFGWGVWRLMKALNARTQARYQYEPINWVTGAIFSIGVFVACNLLSHRDWPDGLIVLLVSFGMVFGYIRRRTDARTTWQSLGVLVCLLPFALLVVLVIGGRMFAPRDDEEDRRWF